MATVALVVVASVGPACSAGTSSSAQTSDPTGASSESDAGALSAAAVEEERQRFLVDCMAERGFTYYPDAPEVGLGDQPVADFEDPDWVANYGLGFSTNFEAAFVAQQSTTAPTESRNDAYVATLSMADLRAYDEALNGSEAENQARAESDDPAAAFLAGEGCESQSYAEMGDVAVPAEDTQIDLSTVDSVAWSRCMADNGYAYSSWDELLMDLINKTDALMGEAIEQVGPGPLVAEGSTTHPSAPKVAFADLPEDLRSRVAELQDTERAIAVVALDCNDAT